MEDELVTLQISATYREKLRQLAVQSKRSMKREFETIIDDEETRRQSINPQSETMKVEA
jgi:hypothetical protein